MVARCHHIGTHGEERMTDREGGQAALLEDLKADGEWELAESSAEPEPGQLPTVRGHARRVGDTERKHEDTGHEGGIVLMSICMAVPEVRIAGVFE
eukprot:3589029-Rhodomonas_salina.1